METSDTELAQQASKQLGHAFSVTGNKRAFLSVYASVGRLNEAARISGVAQQNHYVWKKKDPDYVKDFEVAEQMVADKLEAEIYRRACEGTDEPVGWYQGTPGAWVKRYSDNLAMFRMKSLRPAKYRDNYTVDINHTQTITVDDARSKLLAMIERNPALVGSLRSVIGVDECRQLDAVGSD